MPQKSKADELYERIQKGEIETYFNSFNAEDFRALTSAIADDDMSGITELLLKNLKASKSGFETVLSGRFYDAEIRELANRTLSRELKRRQKEQLTTIVEEEPAFRRIIFPPRDIILARKLPKPVKVKASPRQKEYRKTQPREFTPREIKFLQSRASMTGGQIFKEFIKNFGNIRTNRSVKTKFFRVR